MSKQPRFEVVRSHAGWFARFVAANGAKVWQTEVYERRRAALRAIDLIYFGLLEVRDVDERGATVAPRAMTGIGTVTWSNSKPGMVFDAYGNYTTAPGATS